MSIEQNTRSFFVSDLHGKTPRFTKLFRAVAEEKPGFLFVGGDILPPIDPPQFSGERFLRGYFLGELAKLRDGLGDSYPRVFVILGNDDGRHEENSLIEASEEGLIDYIHGRRAKAARWQVFGYSFVPPTPFRLKDWERYDVSRFVDIGCISPEEGSHSFSMDKNDLKYGTIKEDLEKLTEGHDMDNAIFLFHSPPYKTNIDRADLDGVRIDHTPLDVHVGSIAIQRFIEKRQPLMTMHGHIHESARITGCWRERIGKTLAVTAAHDGPELALVRFDLADIDNVERELI
ncbi:MAG: metallophosphoesterase [Candidatus Krumholzibacteriota bacterium]|nr:metallophosphoesterase [Candidatus Krumholzibacteriota bacterium]